MALPLPALALWGDQLELFAAETLTYDSNVFRLSSGVDPTVAINNSKKSDWSSLTQVGFNLNVPVGRQRFQAGYSYNFSRYDRFSQLDFEGYDARALWLWQVGNELSGQLGYTETKALANFTNFSSVTPNPLKVDRAFVTANYLLTPQWRLSLGGDAAEQRNGDVARRVNDVDVSGIDGGVTYISPAGNQIGVALRTEDGRYPNNQVVSGVPVNNSYTQNTAVLTLDWTFTPQTHMLMRGGWIERKYDQVPGRNFDDSTGRVQVDWRPTGKLTFTAIALKEISPLEDLQTSFILLRGFSFRPAWQITEKTSLALSLDATQRRYLGDPGLVVGTTAPREDKIHGALLTLTWQALRNVQVIGTALRESRSSNIQFNDYDVTVIAARARIAF